MVSRYTSKPNNIFTLTVFLVAYYFLLFIPYKYYTYYFFIFYYYTYYFYPYKFFFSRDIWISESATLVIGYDVAHPGKPSRDEVLNNACPMKPSTVGFACNAAPNPEKFIGDFHYQTPRCEQVAGEVLNARTKWMLRLFLKNRGCLPERIIVVRDGVSEGQYLMVRSMLT